MGLMAAFGLRRRTPVEHQMTAHTFLQCMLGGEQRHGRDRQEGQKAVDVLGSLQDEVAGTPQHLRGICSMGQNVGPA